MKLFIPAIGTKIKLTADWTFMVHPEYRNRAVYEMVHGSHIPEFLWGGNTKYAPKPFTLPAGVIVTIDRIYIKKPSPDYNSVTFRIHKKDINPPEFRGLRFWVKLDDANKIEGDIVL
jgi:hypothetical protein